MEAGSESNDLITGCQPQHPDLQGFFNNGLQAFKRFFLLHAAYQL
jgi:hypothetical protein